MIEITLLHDYQSKSGYRSYLALLSTKRMDDNRKYGRDAIATIKAQFHKMFGCQPLRVRLLTTNLLTAGPIPESEGVPNGTR